MSSLILLNGDPTTGGIMFEITWPNTQETWGEWLNKVQKKDVVNPGCSLHILSEYSNKLDQEFT